jgi:hypothetical protein
VPERDKHDDWEEQAVRVMPDSQVHPFGPFVAAAGKLRDRRDGPELGPENQRQGEKWHVTAAAAPEFPGLMVDSKSQMWDHHWTHRQCESIAALYAECDPVLVAQTVPVRQVDPGRMRWAVFPVTVPPARPEEMH